MGGAPTQTTAAPAAPAATKAADKKPADKLKADTAAPPANTATDKPVNHEDVRAAWMAKKAEGCKAAQLVEILAALEVKGISDIPLERCAEALASINALKK